jgi:uncharacterized membrane protein YeiH
VGGGIVRDTPSTSAGLLRDFYGTVAIMTAAWFTWPTACSACTAVLGAIFLFASLRLLAMPGVARKVNFPAAPFERLGFRPENTSTVPF